MSGMVKQMSRELKVGLLVTATLVFALGLAWLIGFSNPFQRNLKFYITYHFAGGIEVGSPVRVSGIKVGKVERIEFFPDLEKSDHPETEAAPVPLKLTVSIRKDAARGVRKDSSFFINIAGIIGERYIEITPGTLKAEEIKWGETLAGIDPPRIDQLLSQSFNLAGKIQEILEKNEGNLTRSIELLYKLSAQLNQTLKWVDKSAVFKTDLAKLIDNLISITGDIKKLTNKSQTPEGEKTLKLMYDLLWRLEPLNQEAIQKFFQKEGIRAKIF